MTPGMEGQSLGRGGAISPELSIRNWPEKFPSVVLTSQVIASRSTRTILIAAFSMVSPLLESLRHEGGQLALNVPFPVSVDQEGFHVPVSGVLQNLLETDPGGGGHLHGFRYGGMP